LLCSSLQQGAAGKESKQNTLGGRLNPID